MTFESGGKTTIDVYNKIMPFKHVLLCHTHQAVKYRLCKKQRVQMAYI